MKRVMGHLILMLLRIALVFAVAVGLYHFGEYAFDFGEQIYSEEGVTAAPGKDVAVVIYEGESVKQIADMLENYHLIQNSMVFVVQERLSRYHGQILPGNYVLNTSMSGNEMIAILSGHPSEAESEEEAV